MEYTTERLKAAAYDAMVKIELSKKQLGIINTELARRSQEAGTAGEKPFAEKGVEGEEKKPEEKRSDTKKDLEEETLGEGASKK